MKLSNQRIVKPHVRPPDSWERPKQSLVSKAFRIIVDAICWAAFLALIVYVFMPPL